MLSKYVDKLIVVEIWTVKLKNKKNQINSSIFFKK